MTAGIMLNVEHINDRLNNTVTCSPKRLVRQFVACGYGWCAAPHHIQLWILSSAVHDLYLNGEPCEIPPTFGTSQGTELVLWSNIRSWKQNEKSFVQLCCCWHTAWKMAADCSVSFELLYITFFWVLLNTVAFHASYIASL